VHDPTYSRSPQLTRAIHDYFLVKTLDVVRPCGVIALITSRYTMDKQDTKVRDHLSERAVVLGAIRLPNTAFKANAGTEVTTDILFLQKRGLEVSRPEKPWRNLKPIQTEQGATEINEYFIENSEMMLGRMDIEYGQYGVKSPVLVGVLEPAALERALSLLPAAVYRAREDSYSFATPNSNQQVDLDTVKEGGRADRDGQIVVRRGGGFEPLDVTDTVSARIRGMLRVLDAVREVFRSQLSDSLNEQITEARSKLN
jgi:hypothetical protein